MSIPQTGDLASIRAFLMRDKGPERDFVHKVQDKSGRVRSDRHWGVAALFIEAYVNTLGLAAMAYAAAMLGKTFDHIAHRLAGVATWSFVLVPA